MMKVLAMAMLLVALTTEASPSTLIQSPQARSDGDQPIAGVVERIDTSLPFRRQWRDSVMMAMTSLIKALEGVAGLDQEQLGIFKHYVRYLQKLSGINF